MCASFLQLFFFTCVKLRELNLQDSAKAFKDFLLYLKVARQKRGRRWSSNMIGAKPSQATEAIFRILWTREPWLLDTLQALSAFILAPPPEAQELSVALQGSVTLMDAASQ